MVLVVLYLCSSVFMFIQNRNIAFQDATIQSQQLDIDRHTERITILNITYTPVDGHPGEYNIALTIKNTGPLPVQIVRMWVQNNEAEYTNLNISPPIILQSGGKTSRDFSFTMSGTSMGEIVFWLVTARGNLVSANANLVLKIP